MTDWISDPNLSREEKLARFESLRPEVTAPPTCGNCDLPAEEPVVTRIGPELNLVSCNACTVLLYAYVAAMNASLLP